MGSSSSRTYNEEKAKKVINSYKDIIDINAICQEKQDNKDSLKAFLVSTKSIPNYISLINKIKGILKENQDNYKLDKGTIMDFSSYKEDNDIEIYKDYQACINLLKNENKIKNEFIIVREEFFINLSINYNINYKLEIIYDKNNEKLKIKFPSSFQTIYFKRKQKFDLFFEFYEYSENIKKEDNFNPQVEIIPNENINNRINNNNFGVHNPIFDSLEYQMLSENINENNNNINNIKDNIQITLDLIPLLYCMININSLSNYFRANKREFSVLNNDKNKKISLEFSKAANNFRQKKIENYINFDRFFEVFGNQKEVYESKNLFLQLILQMHKELNKNNNIEIIENPPSNQMSLSVEVYKYRNNFNSRNKSIISDTFYFEEIFMNNCPNCNQVSYNCTMNYYFEFLLDEVKIFKKNHINNFEDINIKDCFKFLTNKKNNNNFCCPNCQIRINSSMEYRINSLPEVLTIILNQKSVENGIEFDIDFEIGLEKCLYNWNQNPIQETKYELIGMLTYFGKNNGQDHAAIFKSSFSKNWFLFLNSELKVIDDIKTYKGIPYFLFYQKLK